MNNKTEYITIRDEFCKQLAPQNLDTELKAWEFYINSTDENKNQYLEYTPDANREITAYQGVPHVAQR